MVNLPAVKLFILSNLFENNLYSIVYLQQIIAIGLLKFVRNSYEKSRRN
ncbi:hypothetical protein Bateq7PJ16_4210 [Bacillus subtilis]|nr:hypothetical protein Bateq7PJ16_4210 [Bacillus subtilis]CCU57088.1 hypothetical protein BSUBE1_0457 [Bacillus subtilis E1]